MKYSVKTNSKGFTLVELLVVIAIIGLLASVINVALGSSRTKARDAKRVTDIKQIKTGLDLYFSQGGGYPDKATFDNSYTTNTQLSCGGTTILRVVQDPNYPNSIYDYQEAGNAISGCGSNNLRSAYNLTFTLEKTGNSYTMNQEGIFTPPLPDL